VLLGSAAAVGALGLGAAGATAWASLLRTPRAAAAGGGMPLPDGTTCDVEYRSRAAWGANEAWRNWPAGPEEWEPDHTPYQRLKYTRYPSQTITVHHSAGSTPTAAGAAAAVRGIYQSQANGQGWGDIGYNLLIDPYGVVYEGRYNVAEPWPIFGPEPGPAPMMTTGAHVSGYNAANIGICLLGNFDGSGMPTSDARNALTEVVTALCRLCGIDPLAIVDYVNPVPSADPDDPDEADQPLRYATRTVRAISGHRNWANTACPGDHLYGWLGYLRQAAATRLAQRSRPGIPQSPAPGPSRPLPSRPAVPAPPGDIDRPLPSRAP
jgi:hypothetical protein